MGVGRAAWRPAFVALMLVAAPGVARAQTVISVNGGFTTDALGWTLAGDAARVASGQTGENPFGRVQDGAGSFLYQELFSPGDNFSLQFDFLTGLVAGDFVSPGAFPDTVFASIYFGSTNAALAPETGAFAESLVLFDFDAPSGLTSLLAGAQLTASPDRPGWTRFDGLFAGVTGEAAFAITFQNFTADATPANSAFLLDNFTVTRLASAATVTLSNLDRVYDGTPKSVTVGTTPAGLATSVTYNGTATTPTNAGSYAVVAAITDPNYSGSVTGALVIGPAPLIVRADDKAKVEGTVNPSLTITYIGLLNGETPFVLNTLPASATAAVEASPAGSYVITLTGGTDDNYTLTRQDGVLTVTAAQTGTAPVINEHPKSQTVTLGANVSFTVVASGTAPLVYQWFKNGSVIGGATDPQFDLPAVTNANEGSYSVEVANAYGKAVSHLASLVVEPPGAAPVITRHPDDTTVLEEAKAEFSVRAEGTAPLSYQWYFNGVAIAGATSPKYTIAQAGDADEGLYRGNVSNPFGLAVSTEARLVVDGRNFSGTYHDRCSDGIDDRGPFVLEVRDDNTCTFLGYDTVQKVAYVAPEAVVRPDGTARITTKVRKNAVTPGGIAAAETSLEFDLFIAPDGTLTGTSVELGLTLAATASPATGPAAGVAGFYEGGSPLTGANSFTVVSADGKSFLLTVGPTGADAGVGTTAPDGTLSLTTENNAAITAVFDAENFVMSATVTPPAGGAAVSFVGANNHAREDTERLVNISTRGLTGTGDDTLIGGFVIQGTEPKQVLLRAIGPSLEPYGVTGFIPTVGVRLYRGQTLLATAEDWGAASDAAAIVSAANRVSAFPIPLINRDSAMLVTLTPGAYTIHAFSPAGATGITLLEAYDAASGDIPRTERMINISTRGRVGTGDAVQIAGFVVVGTVPKRVLIRGIGPGLAPYQVAGPLEDPQITLFDAAGRAIALNDNWGSDNDVDQIQSATSAVQAFTLTPGSKDAVLLLNLDPGLYTVHARGVDDTSGVALIEVYEVP